MTSPWDRELLIEEVAGAFRPTRAGGVGSHSAWHDLDQAGREAAFEVAVFNRLLEAAVDSDGLSGTARAVLDRIGT